MPITSSPRPITVNRSLSLPTYTCTTASYPCLPFLVTPCSSLSLPTAPYHSLPLSIPPTAFYHSPLCPIISNLFLSPPIAFYPSQPQRITPHRVKIFFSNAPPHSNLRRSLEINGLKCKLLLWRLAGCRVIKSLQICDVLHLFPDLLKTVKISLSVRSEELE